MIRTVWSIMAVAVVALVLFAGCGEQASGPSTENATSVGTQQAGSPAPSKSSEGEHGHKPSAHGGTVVPIGRDNYHAEAVFEKDGVVRLYTLGNDEAKVIEVEARPLSAFVKPKGGSEATPFALEPAPQAGDGKGLTSQFVGKLPRELWGKRVEVTVPTIGINGERFRFGFESADDSHREAPMPKGVGNAEESKLFLTPGGLYTEADIKANGGVTGSEKFRGFQPAHDRKPKSGDKLCPVTLTKANPACAWIIGGKTYEFCCPPCVEEFLTLAKDTPNEVKGPEAYRKK
jgi:YHS domain-containing protein